MTRISKQKLDTLKKIQYQKLLWSRSINFNYYYDKLLEDCLKGKRFEFIDCYGKNRCKIKTSEDAIKLISSDTFNNGHRSSFISFGPNANLTNRNISAIFRYHYKVINEDVLVALDNLILSDNFKGDREYCLERVKYYVIKLYKEGKIKNISPERILYYELAE